MKQKFTLRKNGISNITIFLFLFSILLILIDLSFSLNVERLLLSKELKNIIQDKLNKNINKNTTFSEEEIIDIFKSLSKNEFQNENYLQHKKVKDYNENNLGMQKEQLHEEKKVLEKTEYDNFQTEILKEFSLDQNSNIIIEGSKRDDLQECLLSEAFGKIPDKNVSKNKKFILGKCNPILLVAGFLGTRLRAVIDCEKLANDPSALSELRYFCGKNLCKNSFFSNYKKEEYTLWPSLFNSPFKLFHDNSNTDNSCMAYFMRFFNDEYECPSLEEISKEKKNLIEEERMKDYHYNESNLEKESASDKNNNEIRLETKEQFFNQFLHNEVEEVEKLINQNIYKNFSELNNGFENINESNNLKKNLNYTNDKTNTYNSEKNQKADQIKKPICFYSKFIKVTYYGNTEETYDKLDCGLRPTCNILDIGYPFLPEKYTNTPATSGYFKLSEFLKAKGYENGFSLAAMPYDFRNFSKKDSKFSKQFYELVEMLYKNTGKKVIVVSHSLGNLLINDILSSEENKEKSVNLIERNIALAPPYVGTAKDMELFISGTREFRTDLPISNVIDVSINAQKFFGSFNPNFYLLFLKPFLNNIANKYEYKEFYDAIRERLMLERKCKFLIDFEQSNKIKFRNIQNQNQNQTQEEICNDDFIEKNSQKFSSLFPFIPKLNSPECKVLYQKAAIHINQTNFINEKFAKRKDIYENLPTYEGCFLRIYDYFNCPLIKVKEENDTSIEADEIDELCIDYEGINQKTNDTQNLFFANSCDGKEIRNNCQENFIKQYTYYDSLNLFKSKSGIEDERIPEKYYLNNSEFQETIKLMQKYQNEISPNKEILPPNVPLSIVYGSFLDTKTSFLYNRNQFDKLFTSDQIHYFGGDGTVNSYSSLLPGLKWIYDFKMKNEENRIEILNYCSFLSKDPKYAYFENLKNNSSMNNTFYALECECLNDKGYDLKFVGKDEDKCSHASLLSDKYIVNFVYISSSKQKIFDDLAKYPEEIKYAFNSYNDKNSYISQCNQILTDEK